MASESSHYNLKSSTNIPLTKVYTSNSNLKSNGNTIGLPKQTIQAHQQPQYLNQPHQLGQNQQSFSSPNLVTSTSCHMSHSASATVLPRTSTSNHHLQPTVNAVQIGSADSTPHGIPPRYQPPPVSSGGILKNALIPKSGPSYYQEVTNPFTLNVRQPLEISKLEPVYTSDSIKGSHSHSRLPPRPPPRPLSAGQAQNHQNSDLNINAGSLQPQFQPQDFAKFVRKLDDSGYSAGLVSAGAIAGMLPGRLSAEQNRHLQSLLADLRHLRETNQRLSEENQELRDLCCFLDDDRQKGRKLAREWQRFGRYTASVMRQEVSAYQIKLRHLDDKQQDLIRDNLEMKELCLYLDEERAQVAANTLCSNCGASTQPTLRDDGDGSSSSTNAEEAVNISNNSCKHLSKDTNSKEILSDQTLQYVRCLEQRIRQLEEELGRSSEKIMSPELYPSRPGAIVRALQVLEVREQLETNNYTQEDESDSAVQLDDGEKALIREMCNVVWRKLEDSPNGSNIEGIYNHE